MHRILARFSDAQLGSHRGPDVDGSDRKEIVLEAEAKTCAHITYT
jgi:hypothetical protein